MNVKSSSFGVVFCGCSDSHHSRGGRGRPKGARAYSERAVPAGRHTRQQRASDPVRLPALRMRVDAELLLQHTEEGLAFLGSQKL